MSVTYDDVVAAAERLAGVANRTPLVSYRELDELVGASVYLKCENLQRICSFKFRGAYNALSRLEAGTRVLTFSSGNHAQAVALASGLLGIDSVIVMPDDAPEVKLASTRALLEGTLGRVVMYSREEITREELGARMAEEEGRVIVPPYDHPHVIAGQGTVGLEMFDEVGEDGFDDLFVCCGGGGLLSGCATVAKQVWPSCRVVGVEPELADDATRSFQTGVLQTVKDPPTIADGARTPYLGKHTFPLVLERVDEMMTVSDDELIEAMRLCFHRLRLVVEPTGVLALAGVVRRRGELRGRRVGVVVSGGNVDLEGEVMGRVLR